MVGAILVEKGNIMGIAKNGPVGLPAIPFMLMCFLRGAEFGVRNVGSAGSAVAPIVLVSNC